MYLALIVMPILGSIVSGFFGRKVGVSGSQLITCSCVIITTFLAIIAFIDSNIISIEISINIMFFLFKTKPKIPIKNKISENFIIYIYYRLSYVQYFLYVKIFNYFYN